MKIMLALLKRELLEHRNIWFVPAILVVIAVLLRLSLAFGDLSIDFDLPSQLQLDGAIDSAISGVMIRGLNWMNYIIMMTMFIVACFYTLSCLYNERQDESVLFWRSLPVSDGMTIASKLIIALLVTPLLVLACQIVVAFIFFGINAFDYLAVYFSSSLILLVKLLIWSLIPTVAWCLFCSEVANKNPFLLAFFAPFLLWVIDTLFLSGAIGQYLRVNRWIGFSDYSVLPLVSGAIVSVVSISLAIVKRSQRI